MDEPERTQIIQHNMALHIKFAYWVPQAKIHRIFNTYAFTLDQFHPKK
jgi:hypothetical protein